MNILFFHRNGICPVAGGISRMTATLANTFKDKGINVFYVAHIHSKNRNCEYDSKQYFLPDPFSSIKASANIDYLREFVIKHSINIVINQSPFERDFSEVFDILRQELGFKLISCYHNAILTPIRNYAYQVNWVYKHSGRTWLFNILKNKWISKFMVQLYILKKRQDFKYCYENSDAIVVLCNGLKSELLQMLGIHNSNKIHVIPNFLTETYSSTIPKHNIVLWIGTTDFRVKRLDYMLDVWSEVCRMNPDWQLVILGDGTDLQKAKTISKNLCLQNITFTGRVDPKKYLETAKIICVTSSHESFSLVTIEGLAAGVYPVVNNSFPAASMLIKDKENGSLVKAFSRKEFAKELNRVMNSPLPAPKTLAESVEKYSPEQAYQNWEAVFNSLK